MTGANCFVVNHTWGPTAAADSLYEKKSLKLYYKSIFDDTANNRLDQGPITHDGSRGWM
jgi:hypothetical protein